MKKLTNKKGFTLMEMIIVIAIIVILAAISIPTLTGNLNSANKAADEANLRAAKSAALVKTMEDGTVTGDWYYDIEAAELKEIAAGTTPSSFGKCGNHDDQYIKVVFANDAVTSVDWADGSDCN